MLIVGGYKKKIYELSEEKAVSLSNIVEELHKTIFQQHPLQEPIDNKKNSLRKSLITILLN